MLHNFVNKLHYSHISVYVISFIHGENSPINKTNVIQLSYASCRLSGIQVSLPSFLRIQDTRLLRSSYRPPTEILRRYYGNRHNYPTILH